MTTRIFALILVLIMAMGMAIVPSYGATLSSTDLKVTLTGASNVMQGHSATLSFELKNLKDVPITYDEISLTFEETGGIKVTPENIGQVTLQNKDDVASISFNIEAARYCKEGMLSYSFTLKNQGEEIYTSRFYTLNVKQYAGSTTDSQFYVDAPEIHYSITPLEGFYKGSDNYINLEIFNAGNNRLKNAVVELVLPEGVGINNGSTSQNVGYLLSGESKYIEFNLLVEDDIEKGNYVFTAKLTGLNASDEAVTLSKSFYIYVYGEEKAEEEDEEETEKTPRLMVSGYDFGGNYVQAGNDFDLYLDLKNTSKRNLYNVKVTLNSSGVFAPVGGSNSFYFEKIEEQQTVQQYVCLHTASDAKQDAAALSVKMEYEDSAGNSYTAEDTISIKVNQKTRLVVDEIVPPYEVYVGNMGSATIAFYNMGKTTLENLRVNAEGNFDIMESNSYYAGNMVPGTDDDYTFSFIPRELGPMEGVITFTYDDVEGNSQIEEVPFVFEVMEMPVWDDPGIYPEPMEEETKIPWSLIIFGAALLLLIIAIIVIRKVRKTRIHKRLELEDANYEIPSDSTKKEIEE